MQEAREPAQYREAAALYESIRAAGVENGALLYDLGNAYLQAGERGRAIAAYRRALRYRPEDPYLAANLANALPPGAPRAEKKSWFRVLLFWQSWISYPAKLHWVAGTASLAFACALAALLAPRAAIPLRRLALAAVGVCLLLGVSLAVDVHDYELTRHGVIVEPEVAARKGNAESFEEAFNEPLVEGTELEVLETRSGWVRVRVQSGLDGWVREEAVVLE
jgi:hypothetical protein